jgi:hypothetical protein
MYIYLWPRPSVANIIHHHMYLPTRAGGYLQPQEQNKSAQPSPIGTNSEARNRYRRLHGKSMILKQCWRVQDAPKSKCNLKRMLCTKRATPMEAACAGPHVQASMRV